MPAINAQASLTINASIELVHSALIDFHTWAIWSPWLYIEPTSQISYRGEPGHLNHGYDWSGNKVGAGSMTLTAITQQQIDYELQFLKPFKSTAQVRFNLQQTATGSTQVTWTMDSRLPIFMFFMTRTMNGMIRSDFRRGLALLKDYTEDGVVHSKSDMAGVVNVDACHYVACKVSTEMANIATASKSSFAQLHEGENLGRYTSSGVPFSIFGRMNYKNDSCTFTAALPVTDSNPVPAPLFSGHRPACRALKLVHTGPYHHLSNAWAMLISEARHQKLKPLKSVPPFECFLNDAQSTPTTELITALHLPLQT